jgi:formylmethanofuran dehydrogenase subunit E
VTEKGRGLSDSLNVEIRGDTGSVRIWTRGSRDCLYSNKRKKRKKIKERKERKEKKEQKERNETNEKNEKNERKEFFFFFVKKILKFTPKNISNIPGVIAKLFVVYMASYGYNY